MKYQVPIFIVSTGRAGSKMIAKTLAKHPAALALHEPLPNLNMEAFAHWKSSHTTQEIKKRVSSKRRDLLNKVEGNGLIYIESSHYCSHLILILNDLYGAKFMYLYRDGRDFVRSGLEREGWYPENIFSSHLQGKKKILQAFKRKVRRRFLKQVGYTWEDHRLLPPDKYRSRVEKISWLWVEINTVIQNSLSKLPADKHISIRLEDFNKGGLNKVLSFLELTASDSIKAQMVKTSEQKPNKTDDRTVLPFNEWKKRDKGKFWNIAKEMMETLEYV